MSWQDSKEYKTALAHLESCYKIAAELGTSNPATESGEKVLLEMRFSAWEHGVDDRIASDLAELVYAWKTEKNTYYMDKASMLCSSKGLLPSPTLFEAIAEAAGKRYAVGHIALKSTAESIKRDAIQRKALCFMMNLIYRDVPLCRAACLTAQWMKDVLQVKPIKASTLDKYYANEYRAKRYRHHNIDLYLNGTLYSLEELYFENWRRNDTDENCQNWKQIIEMLSEAEPDLIGNRRD
ncbi:MAG: hypothetical protein KF888_09090 [Nitrosomonas sp.]|nr:hypothetical protein [Nitrosomonas sp.]